MEHNMGICVECGNLTEYPYVKNQEGERICKRCFRKEADADTLKTDIFLGNKNPDGTWICEHCKETQGAQIFTRYCTYTGCDCGEMICPGCIIKMADKMATGDKNGKSKIV